MRIDAVEAGDDCAHGGYRVNAGVDANANGVLDDVEISETALACASADGQPGAPGSDGSNGNNGANGTSAVLGSEPIAPGAECVNGGTRMNAGLDLNGNGVLDAAEISASVAVCSTAVKKYVLDAEVPLPVGFPTADLTVYANGAAASDTDGDGYPDVAGEGDVLAIYASQVNDKRLLFMERVAGQWVEINQIAAPAGLGYQLTVIGFENRMMVIGGLASQNAAYRSYVIERVNGVYEVTDAIATSGSPSGANVFALRFDGEHVLATDIGANFSMALARKLPGVALPVATPVLLPPGHTVTHFAVAMGRGLLAIPAQVAGVHGLSVFTLTAGSQAFVGRVPTLLDINGYPRQVTADALGDADLTIQYHASGFNLTATSQVWRVGQGGTIALAQSLTGGAYISAPVLARGATRTIARGADPSLGYFPAVYNLVDGLWHHVQVLTDYAGTGDFLSSAAMLAGGDELYVTASSPSVLRLYRWE
ncbi:MAG: hypothetical protein IPL79_00060 [Myxococcales bacterium]|nr:hypothetical protein [Myxococcales bacterium]